MKKKKTVPREYIPYVNNDQIYVSHELLFKNDVIKPGDKIKRKYDRDEYVFMRLAHHIGHDTTWVDAMSVTSGTWHSIRIDDIKCVIRPKRLRRKKVG